ncbi:acetyl-CoA carboxylase biotin carboxylase subunit [Actinophytocola sediminis]
MSAVFDKILVCNRGEIAVRVLRTCARMGIATVVAHSEADRDSAAVRLADEAVSLGPGAAEHSYLNIPAVLYACARTGADAVHPGYGFLAEDALFASACAEIGLTFIGPTPELIGLMGDKVAARRAAAAAGVPLPPGTEDPLEDLHDATSQAEELGYPLILKAAAGGGGRGIAVVPDRDALVRTFPEVRHNARTLFQDGRVHLERFVPAARHVEVQVLGDAHGNVVHLGERDCSVQRRWQKLVEESPSGVLTPQLRHRLGAVAVALARAVGYVSAGTVEFLVDQHGEFYFIELNPRIQVEHPITEVRTGIDLVEQMIRVAAGEPLGFTQDDVVFTGHSVQCRVNAEDPADGWRGSVGEVVRFRPPTGAGVRVDTHVHAGHRVPPFYDSLLAKVVVHAPTRDEALDRMALALAEFECAGVTTTIGFHRQLVDHPVFRADQHSVDFLRRHLGEDGTLRVSPEVAS